MTVWVHCELLRILENFKVKNIPRGYKECYIGCLKPPPTKILPNEKAATLCPILCLIMDNK